MKLCGGYFHLATGVSFLVTSMSLTFANIMIRPAEILKLFYDCPLYGYGWPAFSIVGFPRAFPAGQGVGIYFIEEWHFRGFAINLATAAAILILVTAATEWYSRMIDARKISRDKKPGG